MGITKRLHLEEMERKSMQTMMDEFFECKTLTLDVRVQYKLDTNVADSAPKGPLKNEIRRKMISKFRKELTRQLRDQIG